MNDQVILQKSYQLRQIRSVAFRTQSTKYYITNDVTTNNADNQHYEYDQLTISS